MAQRTVNIGIGNQVVQNDFDAMPIYKEMKEVTDDYGNKFIRIPKFYIHKENTAGKLAIRISKEPIAGGYLPHCFYDHVANKELPYVDVGKYLGSLTTDGKRLESKTGASPLGQQTITYFRNVARASGSGYQQLDIHVVDVLQCLFYVEFATLNSQSIHPGCSVNDGILPTGGTDNVIASSGAMGNSDGFQFMYRGIEDIWGNAGQFVDGVNIIDRQAWVCKDARDYVSDVYSGPYEKLGYTNFDTGGFVTEMGYDPKHPYAQFPIKGGGSEHTHYADFYTQATGSTTAILSAPWGTPSQLGISFWLLARNPVSAASVFGSRLVRKPI